MNRDKAQMTISKDVCPDSERYLLDRVAQGCRQSHTLRRFVYRVPLEAVEGRTTYVHSNSCRLRLPPCPLHHPLGLVAKWPIFWSPLRPWEACVELWEAWLCSLQGLSS